MCVAWSQPIPHVVLSCGWAYVGMLCDTKGRRSFSSAAPNCVNFLPMCKQALTKYYCTNIVEVILTLLSFDCSHIISRNKKADYSLSYSVSSLLTTDTWSRKSRI